MTHRNFTNVGSRRTGEFFVPTAFNGKYRTPTDLGTGGYGTVIGFESVDKSKRNDIAVKRFDKPFDTAKKAQRCFRELQLLRDLEHDNIVKMCFAYTTAGSAHELVSVYLTTEYAGGDLGLRLEHETEATHQFTLRSFQTMISELLRALKYLNSANVIHRDLKPDNLAISDSGKLTLLDFGIARAMGERNEMTQGPGSGYYRAIETVSFDQSDRQVYNEKADIWSIGAILCEMITGRVLFKAEANERDNPILKAIQICGPIPEIVIQEGVDHEPSRKYLRDKSRTAVRIHFLENFMQNGRSWLRNDIVQNGPALIDFINRTLAFDHRERLSVDGALAHPFLASVRVPSKEVVAGHQIHDFGDLQLEEWKQLIWEVIQASPVRID